MQSRSPDTPTAAASKAVVVPGVSTYLRLGLALGLALGLGLGFRLALGLARQYGWRLDVPSG